MERKRCESEEDEMERKRFESGTEIDRKRRERIRA